MHGPLKKDFLQTIHRSVDGYKPTYRAKLDTLPWWVASQYLTTKRITDSIENAYFLVSNREYIIEYIANSC